MKNLLFFVMMFAMQAQRCAVLEFKAGVGVSQSDVDGISAIFITYFRPAGYTMVERTQIDKVIEEQGFQRSHMTQSQMVRVGQILNAPIDYDILASEHKLNKQHITYSSTRNRKKHFSLPEVQCYYYRYRYRFGYSVGAA